MQQTAAITVITAGLTLAAWSIAAAQGDVPGEYVAGDAARETIPEDASAPFALTGVVDTVWSEEFEVLSASISDPLSNAPTYQLALDDAGKSLAEELYSDTAAILAVLLPERDTPTLKVVRYRRIDPAHDMLRLTNSVPPDLPGGLEPDAHMMVGIETGRIDHVAEDALPEE